MKWRLLSLRWRFVPRDVWVGAYWAWSQMRCQLDIYVCLLPCLPLHATLTAYWPDDGSTAESQALDTLAMPTPTAYDVTHYVGDACPGGHVEAAR